MDRLVGYRDLTDEQLAKIKAAIVAVAKDLKLQAYDFGGGHLVAPSVGTIDGAEALMFILEKRNG
jgi:hypothetical protein